MIKLERDFLLKNRGSLIQKPFAALYFQRVILGAMPSMTGKATKTKLFKTLSHETKNFI